MSLTEGVTRKQYLKSLRPKLVLNTLRSWWDLKMYNLEVIPQIISQFQPWIKEYYYISMISLSQLVRLVNENPIDDIPDFFAADAASSFLPLKSLGTSRASCLWQNTGWNFSSVLPFPRQTLSRYFPFCLCVTRLLTSSPPFSFLSRYLHFSCRGTDEVKMRVFPLMNILRDIFKITTLSS